MPLHSANTNQSVIKHKLQHVVAFKFKEDVKKPPDPKSGKAFVALKEKILK